MILSSCGCTVSWALRGGVRLLREPRRLFRLAGDTHSLKMRVTGVLFTTAFAPIPPPTGRENPPDSPGLNHLQICGFFDGDEGCGERMLPSNSPCPPATGACHAPVQASRKKIDFCANFIREISMKVNTCYQRKSGNTPRWSRYACRACSRSSALGAVLYLSLIHI